MQTIRILAVIAGMLSGVVAHAGDVYKYVDERGATLYTDKPMPGAVLVSRDVQRPAEVTQRNTNAQQTANANAMMATNQRINESQTNARAAEAVARDLEATRAERCKQARTEYDKTINSRRLYREENGERKFLDDSETAQARVDARKRVDAICGPQG
jgi:Domain of unknown function (DUF4124)